MFTLPRLLAGALGACVALVQKKNPFLWFGIGFVLGLEGCFILFVVFPLVGLYLTKRAFKKTKQKASKPTTEEPTTLDVTPSFDLEVEPSALKRLWYFLDKENKAIGPISFQLFYQRWQEGRILATTHIWNETLSEWKPFKEVFPKAKTPS